MSRFNKPKYYEIALAFKDTRYKVARDGSIDQCERLEQLAGIKKVEDEVLHVLSYDKKFITADFINASERGRFL